MTPLYTVAENRAIENALFAVVPSFSLMQRAGAAVAEAALTMQQGAVLAIAGNGNNGGDAAVAATLLRQRKVVVRLLQTADAATLPPDAARAMQQWQESGGETLTLDAVRRDGKISLPPATLLIDGLFGIGLSRPPQGVWQELIAAINRHPAPVLAIDIPSGVAADSGAVLGNAVYAARTVTFFGGKAGLYTGAGAQASGAVHIASLDAPPYDASGALMDSAPDLQRLRRAADSHKGSFNTLALYGGAEGMLGALVLAARAAATLGAGKTIACAMQPSPPVDWLRPDIMWRTAADGADGAESAAGCIAAGMGMGTDARAQQQLAQLVPLDLPLLLDADALTLLAQSDTLRGVLRRRRAPTILTPHPGEAARLLGCSAAQVNAHRPAAAAELAEKWQATIVLKGGGSIIQHPGAPFVVCAAGNPGLARGGSGDVLSGTIAALLAQTADASFAARTGVWLHAAAADALAAHHGQLGVDVNQLAQEAARLSGV